MARLYADEQFPYEVVEYLRDLGHYVLTVQEAGNVNPKMDESFRTICYCCYKWLLKNIDE